jgi:cell fate (sporulation/competence/biofilm development) regulator YlbF (YheA/YmcA/DUF963 family)
MSIETPDAAESAESVDVEALGRELGEAITDLPEYDAFEEAQARVENDPEAQRKIDEFESLRQEFVLARQTGEATQEDLRELQRTQQELHAIPAMSEYLEAQNELDARLEAINEAISEPLAMDFGEQAGGCCQE